MSAVGAALSWFSESLPSVSSCFFAASHTQSTCAAATVGRDLHHTAAVSSRLTSTRTYAYDRLHIAGVAG
jgi:hypothetical protein